MTERIWLLVPSRGRPENMRELADAVADTTGVVDLVAVLDEDDERLSEYPPDVDSIVTEGGHGGMVGALNAVAPAMSRGRDFVAFLGDDHRPRSQEWGERFVAELERLRTGFVYGNDLLQGEEMPTAIAMTSNVVRALGYMAPPGLTHLNVDIAWKEWGRRLDRIVYLEEVVIEHVHPAIGKAPLDAGYERVNSVDMVARDGEAWARYVAEDLEADLEKLRALP